MLVPRSAEEYLCMKVVYFPKLFHIAKKPRTSTALDNYSLSPFLQLFCAKFHEHLAVIERVFHGVLCSGIEVSLCVPPRAKTPCKPDSFNFSTTSCQQITKDALQTNHTYTQINDTDNWGKTLENWDVLWSSIKLDITVSFFAYGGLAGEWVDSRNLLEIHRWHEWMHRL